MPMMNIYKFADDKWHIRKPGCCVTDCGLPMAGATETLKLGPPDVGGSPDPAIYNCCDTCFEFMKATALPRPA